MALKYALIENLLTDNTDDYTAQVQESVSRTMAYIVREALIRGTTLGEEDIDGAVKLVDKVMAEITAKGETINTDLCKTRLSMSGVFQGAADGYDLKRHRIKVNASPGKLLTEAISKIKIDKVTGVELLPHILEAKDSVNGSMKISRQVEC